MSYSVVVFGLKGLIRWLLLALVAITACRAQGSDSECKAVQQEVSKLQAWVRFNQDQIRALAFKNTNESIKDWEKVGEAARQKLITSALDTVFTALANGLLAETNIGNLKLKNGIGSLNPAKAQQIIGKLNGIGLNDPILFDAIRALGSVSNKTETTRRVIERLTQAKDIYAASLLSKTGLTSV